MCQLPKGYYWRVDLIQSLDSVHLALCKKWRTVNELNSECVVLDFSRTDTNDAAKKIAERSHVMWKKFVKSSYGNTDEWESRAKSLQKALSHPGVDVRVKVERV